MSRLHNTSARGSTNAFQNHDYERLCLEKTRQKIEENLKHVSDWTHHIKQATSGGLTAKKISKYRSQVPEMENLSDDQIQSVYREIVLLKAKQLEKQNASSSPSPPPKQPHGQTDTPDHSSSQREDEQLSEASSGHLNPSGALDGTHAINGSQRSRTSSASPHSRSVPRSVSSSGQISESTNADQSPSNDGTRASHPEGTHDETPQAVTPISSANRATPASNAPSSKVTPHQGPRSLIPVPATRIQGASGQGQNAAGIDQRLHRAPQQSDAPSRPGKQGMKPLPAATEAPRAPPLSRPAQPNAQKQQPPSPWRLPPHRNQAPSQPSQPAQPAQPKLQLGVQQQLPLSSWPLLPHRNQELPQPAQPNARSGAQQKQTTSAQLAPAHASPPPLQPAQPAQTMPQPGAQQQQPPSAQKQQPPTFWTLPPQWNQAPAQPEPHPSAQQQQPPSAHPVTVQSFESYLTVSDWCSEPRTITVRPERVSDRFQRHSWLFRVGTQTAVQAFRSLSLALELLDQVAFNPLLSRNLTPLQLLRIRNSRTEAFTVLDDKETELSTFQIPLRLQRPRWPEIELGAYGS